MTEMSSVASPRVAPPYIELHARSAFSFLRAGSGVAALVERAAALGMSALALTDHMTLAGAVRFQAACLERGIRPIFGAELALVDPVFGDRAAPAELVVLAADAVGYATLCRLLTEANLTNPARPLVPFRALAERHEGLLVLTGGRAGSLARLILAGRGRAAEEVAHRYAETFGPERVFVELQHHRLPDSVTLMQRLVWIAEAAGLRTVATNGVCYAAPVDHPLYDVLTCVRLGITVDMPHEERPRNDEASLADMAEMTARFQDLPWGVDALAASGELAAACTFALPRDVCRAPRVPLPAGETPATHLRALCEVGLRERYADIPTAQAASSPQRRQLAHELEVIARLELEEFFLCVADIVTAARAMGIRCSGRGSAANSLVAYLLRITGVDPLEQHLLFERFLNPERRGMPDIDIDVQSDRREELIRYVERTYTHEHAAMVANVITYRARSALRDLAKALGFPLALVNRLTKVLHHHTAARDIARAEGELVALLAEVPEEGTRARCRARLPLLLALAPRLTGLPRHLSLHNGGLVLTREPLSRMLPVRLSANSVRALEVDKDDVEALGLIKFDLLGLRTLGAIEECLALVEETTGERLAIDALPIQPPDPATMRLIRAGQTLAVFQIESPGQWHLLAQTQPRTFQDLIIQTALFRPGPLQGGFVRPYVDRRQGRQAERQPARRQRDAVQTPWHGAPADDFWTAHPLLGPLLADTEGIVLFQEQILLIAHAYAGLSYAEADGFRRAMSHARAPAEMEAMRARFLAGAVARGEPPEEARRVFEAISNFVGYGFCRSHAAEFARTIYQTAWLKAHYPAHYLAAFLTSQPAGFFPPHVVLEEARQLGIPILPVEINASEDRFGVARVGARRPCWAIRIGLAQVTQVGEELAQAILWERRGAARGAVPDGVCTPCERPFRSLADFCARMRPAGLTWGAAEALVLAGAFAGLHADLDRRRLLWHLHEIWPLVGTTRRMRRGAEDPSRPEQLPLEWQVPREAPATLPRLPALDRHERAALDYALLGMSARPHPLALQRRDLRRRGVLTIAQLASVEAGRTVRVAGWAISAQRPPTAKGMGFLVLEDETGRLPVALPPRLAERMHATLRAARVVAVAGRVERVRWYRSLLALDLAAVEAV